MFQFSKITCSKKAFQLMPKKASVLSLLLVLFVALSCNVAQATLTVATFSDPSQGSNETLFTVDIVNGVISGGWPDSKGGLVLEVSLSGNTYLDAFFTMTDVTYVGDISGGNAGQGTIMFFAENQPVDTAPLIEINFSSGYLTPIGFGGTDFSFFGGSGNNVTITGSEINGVLSNESFSFSFVNQKLLSDESGYTATASFTSSAIPEPATIILLSLGGLLSIMSRKKVS